MPNGGLEILKYEFGWWQRLKEKYLDEKEPYFETFSVFGSKGAKVKYAVKEFEMLKFCRMMGGMLNI